MTDIITPADEIATLFPADSVTFADAAKLLRCTLSAMYTYAARGRIRTFKVGGRRWTTRSALADFIRASNGEPPRVARNTAHDDAVRTLQSKGLMQ